MAKYLLDTPTFLAVTAGLQTGRATRAAYSRSDAQIFLSIASIWEMAIKISLKKLQLLVPLQKIVQSEVEQNRLEILPIAVNHTLKVAELPFLHRDPFDRLLAAQAILEDMILLTSDAKLRRYPGLKTGW